MVKVTIVALILLTLVACKREPDSEITASKLNQYTTTGVVVDPATNSIILTIKVAPTASQSEIKAIAGKIIAEHKSQYKKITVKTYLQNMSESDIQHATSTLEDDNVTHIFHPRAESVRIPTH